MSHEAVTWAMDDAPMLLTEKGKPDTTARHVLQVLAEHARKDGSGARPSLLRLEYRTGYDRRTVQRALRRLEEGKLISADGVVNGCTVYCLALHLKRPATDWDALEREEARQRDVDAERQRRYRNRHVTHSGDVTVTDAESVTEGSVTDADDVSHALSVRTSRILRPDVTDATPPEPLLEPSVKPSLSLVAPEGAGCAVAEGEREIEASPAQPEPTTAQKAVRGSGTVSFAEEAAFIAWVTAKHQVRGPGWWHAAAKDLPEHAAAWRAATVTTAPGVLPWLVGVPQWCGNCGDVYAPKPAARFNPKMRTLDGRPRGVPCPVCNPAARKDAAA